MTAEEWIRHAVEQLDSALFGGELDILNHPYQISWGKVKGKGVTESIQPSDSENISLDDLFPTTIVVSYEIKDTYELLGNLALECIHAFFNEKGMTKQFKKLAEKYYFEKPYKSYNPSPHLSDLIKEVHDKMIKEYGKFPLTPVKFYKKEPTEKKKSVYTSFCPECGYEVRIQTKMLKKFNNAIPTCPCGCKMGLDLSDETDETNE